jgi:hypothetical protein
VRKYVGGESDSTSGVGTAWFVAFVTGVSGPSGLSGVVGPGFYAGVAVRWPGTGVHELAPTLAAGEALVLLVGVVRDRLTGLLVDCRHNCPPR